MIFLDMDGVIANFVQHFLNTVTPLYDHDQIDRWDMHVCLGMTEDRMWELINRGGSEWWRTVPEYYDTNLLYPYLKQIDKVVFLTSPGRSPHACKGKLEWLQHRFGHDFRDWVFTTNKHLLANAQSILIDDSPKNCRDFMSNQGHAILFPRPWNLNDCQGLIRPRIGDVPSMVSTMLGKP